MTFPKASDARQNMSHADMQLLCAKNPDVVSKLPLTAETVEEEDYCDVAEPIGVMTRFPDNVKVSPGDMLVRPMWLGAMPPVGTRLYTEAQLSEAIQLHDSERESDMMSPEWKGGYSAGFEIAKKMLSSSSNGRLAENFRSTLDTQCQDLMACVDSMRQSGKYQPQVEAIIQVVSELKSLSAK